MQKNLTSGQVNTLGCEELVRITWVGWMKALRKIFRGQRPLFLEISGAFTQALSSLH